MEENETSATTASSLHDALDQATEHKPESEFTQTGWDFDKVDQGAGEDAEAEPGEEKEAGVEHKKTADGLRKPKVPDEVKRASAETATATTEAVMEMIAFPIIDYKFKKKFSKDQLARGLELEDKEFETLNTEEQKLQARIKYALKTRDKKREAIPLDKDEKKGVMDAWYQYFKIKDAAIGPEVLLYLLLGRLLVNRTVEIARD